VSIFETSTESYQDGGNGPVERVDCALCNVDDHKVILKAKDYRFNLSENMFGLVQCKRCGLIYLNPRPTRRE